MENKYFSPEETLALITDKFPELISLLVNKGFAQLGHEEKRKEFGSRITLKDATSLKGLNLDNLITLMVREIENNLERGDKGISRKNGGYREKIRIEGLLPCPVRIPLMEELEKFIFQMKLSTSLDLRSASQGVEWLKESLLTDIAGDNLADIFISAGFDLFFDRRLMDGFRRQGVFKDSTGIDRLNRVFVEAGVDLIDPEGDYSVLSVVPAVFLINREELGDREVPVTWEAIISDEFTASVSLPVSDFDLFNAILINIYKKYGKEGVGRLARSMSKAQHPAQMIKDGGEKGTGEAAVTIMPYFFTRMAKRFPHLEFIWPEDGAIISPIFMLTKKDSLPVIQPIIDFFASEKIGKIFAQQGLFPSILPGIDNNLKEGARFMWPGWDFLRREDPGRLIEDLTEEFNNTIKGEN